MPKKTTIKKNSSPHHTVTVVLLTFVELKETHLKKKDSHGFPIGLKLAITNKLVNKLNSVI